MSRDLGAPDNRKKQMRPTNTMEVVPHSRGNRSIKQYHDENGILQDGSEFRPYAPTDEYRFLLSPETRKRLEER